MRARLVRRGWLFVLATAVFVFLSPPASAQGADAASQQPMPATTDGLPHQHQHGAEPIAGGDSAGEASSSDPIGNSMARDASGTAWLPDSTPMYMLHAQSGSWTLMGHGSVFAYYVDEGGDRGGDQAGSVNWLMGMAERPVRGGPLRLQTMISVERITVGACGYPDLLATGETCHGESLHDRQHPHDLFMEIAARYRHALSGTVAYELYGGVVGEPALGPAAYPHRLSALQNPFAPISHHWLDATHISFGVATVGVYSRRWKVEGSAFNGREPDENRYDLDLARFDSYSGRAWFLPNDRWALQVSAGRLTDAEAAHDGEGPADVTRVTASASYHRRDERGAVWATTAAWGRNTEAETATDAWLVETALPVSRSHTIFGRAEINEKTGHDLALPDLEARTFTVGKLTMGAVRRLPAAGPLVPGVGASVSVSVVPHAIARAYGGRASIGFSVFVSLRPREMATMAGHSHAD